MAEKAWYLSHSHRYHKMGSRCSGVKAPFEQPTSPSKEAPHRAFVLSCFDQIKLAPVIESLQPLFATCAW